MKKNIKHSDFLILHGVAVLGVLLFPLYIKFSAWLGQFLDGCLLHRFFIYCPLCGGTRAISALLRFDLISALKYNALVVFLVVLALVLDVWAWVRFFQKKEPLIVLPKWFQVTFWTIYLGYFVLRNILMIFWGIDSTGDLVYFWDAIHFLRG